MQNINSYLDTIARKTGYGRLERRERMFVWGGVVFVLGFLLFQGVVSPYLEASQRLERALQRQQNDLLEMQILQTEYRELKRRQGEITRLIQQRERGFSLFSFLEQQADGVKLKNRVAYMKPSTSELDDNLQESAVEMKMEQITLGQLVDFLASVESADRVVLIKRLAVQKNKKESDLLDMVVNIVTFEKKIDTT